MAIPFDECRANIIATAQRIVAESGESEDFDAETWADLWMTQPLPAVGGMTPKQYLAAGQPCDRLIDVLLQMQSGAFA